MWRKKVGGSRRREEGRGEKKKTAFSRGGIVEEVQTKLHLHNRYIPTTWTGVEADSSVSSVHYIARFVLVRRSEDLSRDRKR